MKKRLSTFFLVIIILVLTAMILGFVPQWEYSLSSLKFINSEVELEIRDYENNLMINEQRKKDLENVKKELEAAQKEAPDLTKYEARFHYPSLIILLEEEAVKKELELTIHHDRIKNISHMVKSEVDEDNKTEEGKEIEESKLPVPSQRGVDVTVVPISLKGDYDAIRDYIVFLEERDYMVVNSYNITAAEGVNKADIEFAVYSVIVD